MRWNGTAPCIDYPIDSGGRPLHSWPTFVLFPFAIGILAAAISGLIAFFWQSGLPRLHHPLFDADGFERVSQDAFLLAFTAPDRSDPRKLRTLLRDAGALAGLGDDAVRPLALLRPAAAGGLRRQHDAAEPLRHRSAFEIVGGRQRGAAAAGACGGAGRSRA